MQGLVGGGCLGIGRGGERMRTQDTAVSASLASDWGEALLGVSSRRPPPPHQPLLLLPAFRSKPLAPLATRICAMKYTNAVLFAIHNHCFSRAGLAIIG